MNKKITSSALAALMIAGSTSFSAFAAMSTGTVVIGNKAFTIDYVNDAKNIEEIGKLIVAGGDIFVKDFAGNWVNNTSGLKVEASAIPAVTYKDAAGKESKIAKGDGIAVDGSLKVKAVKAISNTKVQVTLEEAVTAVDAASFKVTAKGSDKALEVKSAVLESSKVVVLETAAMTAGAAYKLAADKDVNFTGIGAEKTTPTIVSVKCVDTNQVDIEFNKTLDYTTATNIANYKLDNSAKVVAASLDSSRKIITLTTEGVVQNKMYKVDIENLLGIDGVKVAKVTRNFSGKEDKIAPTAKAATAVATTNNRIKLTFNDEHGVDKVLATDKANYSIKNGTTELAIVSITALDEDENGYYEGVEVVTEAQVAGKKYDITISNLTDGSVSKNLIKKPLTFSFYGRVADKQAPTIDASAVKSLNNTTVKVTFNESNALDLTTVLDVANYEFNGDLQALSVKVIDNSDLYSTDAKTVLITTSEQTKTKSYTLTVKNVADEFGNAMKALPNGSYQKYFFSALGADTIAPYVTSIVAVDNTTVKVTFNEEITKAMAQDPTNYAISNSTSDLGKALKATLDTTDRKTVTLTTLAQNVNAKYTVTVNGIQDLLGNTSQEATAQFIAKKVSSDAEKPTILYAQQVNKDEVLVYFSEAVTYNGTTLSASLNGITTGINLTYVDSINDDTVLIFKPTKVATIVDDSTVYLNNFTATDITDKSGNAIEYRGNVTGAAISDRTQFSYNSSIANEAPEVVSYEQPNSMTIRVRFNERVQLTNGLAQVTLGTTVTKLTTPKISLDKTYIDFVATSNFDFSKVYDTNFTNIVKDMAGTPAKSVKTEITPYISDSEKPFIVNANAVDNSTVEIEFNEDLGSKDLSTSVGSYRLYRLDINGNKVYLAGSAKTAGTGAYQYVNFTTTSEILKTDTTYYLEVIGGARDISGNVMDTSGLTPFSFQGSDKVDMGVVDGIKLMNASKFRLPVETTTTAVLEVKDAAATNGWLTVATLTGTLQTNSTTNYEFTSPVAFVEGQTYRANGYEFKGIATNPGVRVLVDNDGFAKIDYSGIDTAKQTITAYKANATSLVPLSSLIVDGANVYVNGLTAGDVIYVVVKDQVGGNVVYGGRAEVTNIGEDYKVGSNNAPVASVVAIADKLANVNAAGTYNIADFTDADSDTLTYTAKSSDAAKVDITLVSGNIINFNPKAIGDAVITITAQDGKGGSATKDFKVIVAPELTASTILFANGVTVAKVTTDAAFTNAVSGVGAGAITYTSGTPGTATVNATTGEVTIVAAGTTIITATKAATATHSAVTVTYTVNVAAAPLTASTIVFADGATVAKLTTDVAFTNAVSGVGTGTITYTSGTPGTATVNATTGEVTIVAIGTTIITATKAATATHSAVTVTYTVTVS